MDTVHSKSLLIYREIKHSLRHGHYVPGQRIEPATLATEFHSSHTPVRFALYRLVGEALIIDHARDGLHVPLPNETALRNFYDWMERLLLIACDGPASHRVADTASRLATTHDDLAKSTWHLFDAIAHASGDSFLHHTVKRLNDRLAPIRHAEQDLFGFGHDELPKLTRLWLTHDLASLKPALHAYHQRRRELVPIIVALLDDHAR